LSLDRKKPVSPLCFTTSDRICQKGELFEGDGEDEGDEGYEEFGPGKIIFH